MPIPSSMMECPNCKEKARHRVLDYGDGTAIAWCGSCHNPREMLSSGARRPSDDERLPEN
jgi:hypothetical protein